MKKSRKRRLERVTLLLTPHEKRVLEAYAERADVSVTKAVRGVLGEQIDGFAQKPMPG